MTSHLGWSCRTWSSNSCRNSRLYPAKITLPALLSLLKREKSKQGFGVTRWVSKLENHVCSCTPLFCDSAGGCAVLSPEIKIRTSVYMSQSKKTWLILSRYLAIKRPLCLLTAAQRMRFSWHYNCSRIQNSWWTAFPAICPFFTKIGGERNVKDVFSFQFNFIF